jgi:predicted outer membrane protein
MVDDHSKANKQLMEIARRKGMTFSAKVDDTHQKLMDRLRERRGAAFDRDFARHMVRDHKEAVALFKSEARHGRDADPREFCFTDAAHARAPSQDGPQTGKAHGGVHPRAALTDEGMTG